MSGQSSHVDPDTRVACGRRVMWRRLRAAAAPPPGRRPRRRVFRPDVLRAAHARGAAPADTHASGRFGANPRPPSTEAPSRAPTLHTWRTPGHTRSTRYHVSVLADAWGHRGAAGMRMWKWAFAWHDGSSNASTQHAGRQCAGCFGARHTDNELASFNPENPLAHDAMELFVVDIQLLLALVDKVVVAARSEKVYRLLDALAHRHR